MRNTNILSLHDITDNMLPLVGGKALNLALLLQAGYPVPNGWCLTTATYQNAVGTQIAKLNWNRKLNATEIREEIAKIDIEQTIPEILHDLITRLNVNDTWAIRSSATAEDLPGMSFAGQQDTFLNTRGESEILKAIHQCWISLYTDRAYQYRQQNNIIQKDVQMAVVIQKMIDCQVAGVAFTANPLNGDRNQLIIEAVEGTGDALVSGIKTPDRYIINKKTGIVKQEERQHPCTLLKDSQVIELVKICMDIEKYFGNPQDIEWGFSKSGKLYVLQSRPITTLYPLPTPMPKDNSYHFYISFAHIQMMMNPILPLGLSVLARLIPFGKFNKEVNQDSPLAVYAGGRLFIDMTKYYKNHWLKSVAMKGIKVVDQLLENALHQVLEEDFTSIKARPIKSITLIRSLSPVARKILKLSRLKEQQVNQDFVNDYINRRYNKFAERVTMAKEGPVKLQVIKKELSTLLLDLFYNIVPYIALGIIISFRLRKILKEKIGSDQDVDILLQGLEGNITTEMGLCTGDIADSFRRNPKVEPALYTNSWQEVWDILQKYNATEVESILNNFLLKYGFRASGEIDLTKPRWHDNPALLFSSIIGQMKEDDIGQHRQRYQELINKSNTAAERIILACGNKQRIKKLIKYIKTFAPLREHPKYTIIRCFGLARKALLNEAKKLKEWQYIKEIEDIFYLTLDEIEEVLQNPSSQNFLIEKRKNEYELYNRITPPRILTSFGKIYNGQYTNIDLPENSYQGVPVSTGIIEARARVMFDPTTEYVLPGEILVTRFTDPGWTPHFINAVGLVLEIGGIMTHGAVVAREYGIPALVGVENATSLIKTGDLIRVDAQKGYVEIIN